MNITTIAVVSACIVLSACSTTQQAKWEAPIEPLVKERYASVGKFEAELAGAAINKGYVGHALTIERKNIEGLYEIDLSKQK